jgi:hypothetical protein
LDSKFYLPQVSVLQHDFLKRESLV